MCVGSGALWDACQDSTEPTVPSSSIRSKATSIGTVVLVAVEYGQAVTISDDRFAVDQKQVGRRCTYCRSCQWKPGREVITPTRYEPKHRWHHASP
jgi:hypothetical protein